MTDGESRLLSSVGYTEFTGCSHLPKEYLQATLHPTNLRWFSEQRGRHQPTAKVGHPTPNPMMNATPKRLEGK